MLFLTLSILASVSLFIIFRLFSKFGINTFQAITVNYVVCVFTGIAFVDSGTLTNFDASNWWGMAFFLGTMFISTFYLMGIATQKIGVATATLANKMSMVIPVLFNLLVFKSTTDFDIWNGLGLLAALVAIILSNYSTPPPAPPLLGGEFDEHRRCSPLPIGEGQGVGSLQSSSTNRFILPISIFFLGGVIDTSISYANLHLLKHSEEGIFPIILFAVASTIGLIIIIYKLITKQEKIEAKNILAGVILGIPNYFSIYFLLKALTAFEGNGAFVMPVLSIGIIVVAAIVSAIFLGDKLNKFSISGIFMAVIAIILLSYQKIS